MAEWFLAKSDQTTQLPSKTDGKHDGACSCKCKAIVESVLVPLARHYMAMGDAARAFYYRVECAAAYLHVSNSYMVSCTACQHPGVKQPLLRQMPGTTREDEAGHGLCTHAHLLSVCLLKGPHEAERSGGPEELSREESECDSPL